MPERGEYAPPEARTSIAYEDKNTVEEKLKDFIFDERTGRSLLDDVDRGLTDAIETNNQPQIEKLRVLLDKLIEQSKAEAPQIESLSAEFINYIKGRIEELKAALDEKVAKIGGDEVTKERISSAIEKALEEINRKQTSRNMNDGKPFTTRQILDTARDQAEEVRHKGGSSPEFDIYSSR